MDQTIRLGPDEDTAELRIVGIAPLIRQDISPGAQFDGRGPLVYVPFPEQPPSFFTMIARGQADPDTLLGGLQTAVRETDSDLPTADAMTYDERLAEFSFTYRVFMSVFAVAAMIALVLSSAGIFGVTAYSVDQRTQEIGMRVALGATGRNILWLVTGRGMRQLIAGVILGGAGAFALTRFLGSFMFDVGTGDPFTLIAVILLLSAVTVSACLIPARRATRLDPMDAIRFE